LSCRSSGLSTVRISPQTDDERIAYWLLIGAARRDKRGRLSRYNYSANTKPTETEARAALAKVLLSGDIPRCILSSLALLFDPKAPRVENDAFDVVFDPPPRRKLVFKNISRGHSNRDGELQIAILVARYRGCGCSYAEAVAKVEQKFGIGERQIKRAYSKYKDHDAIRTITRYAPFVARRERELNK